MRRPERPSSGTSRLVTIEDPADRLQRPRRSAPASIVSGGSMRRTFHACEAGCTMTPLLEQRQRQPLAGEVAAFAASGARSSIARAVRGRGCRRRADARRRRVAQSRRASPRRVSRLCATSRSSSDDVQGLQRGDGRESVAGERRAVQIEAAHRAVRRLLHAARRHRHANATRSSRRRTCRGSAGPAWRLPAGTRKAIPCGRIRSALRRTRAACRVWCRARRAARR